jgi:hypothetical protein
MTTFEAFGFAGFIGGAIVGAVLCKPYGMLAEAGGALGGSMAGLLAGTLLGISSVVIYAFARATAQIYWELLTGQRRLPSTSSTTVAHRRRVLGFIAVILVASAVFWTGLYFATSEEQRLHILWFAALMFGLSAIGLFILMAAYRHYPARKEDTKNE